MATPSTARTGAAERRVSPRPALVRITHWLTFLAFVLLLFTGGEIILTHPRFYWGEVGNVNVAPAFTLPIPSSRDTVPTRYDFVLSDQNGWGRALHLEAAWLLVFCGLVYGCFGLFTGHFRHRILPAPGHRGWPAYRDQFRAHLRGPHARVSDADNYNVLQRTAYALVIFVAFPLMIWTGLAMSPAFTAAFPWTSILLGGRQTARTLHFFLSWGLVAFLLVHLVMVARSGFRRRTRAMIFGRDKTRT